MTAASLSGTALSAAVIRFVRTHPADFKKAGEWLDETYSVKALTAKDRAFYKKQAKRRTPGPPPDPEKPKVRPPVPLLRPRQVRVWKCGERISEETGSLVEISPPGPYSEKHCSVPVRLRDAVWDLLEGMCAYVAPVLPPLEFSRRVVLVYWLIVDSETDTFLPMLTEMQDWSFGLEMNNWPSEADMSKHSLMHVSAEAVVPDCPAWEAAVGGAWGRVSSHADELPLESAAKAARPADSGPAGGGLYGSATKAVDESKTTASDGDATARTQRKLITVASARYRNGVSASTLYRAKRKGSLTDFRQEGSATNAPLKFDVEEIDLLWPPINRAKR